MNWLDAAQTVLSNTPEPRCAAFETALPHAQAGRLSKAGDALDALSDTQRLIGALIVEIEAAAHPDLVELCARLPDAPDLSAIPRRLVRHWSQTVGVQLRPAQVARRDGRNAELLIEVINALCAAERAEDAIAYAERLPTCHPVEVAQAWGRILYALPADHAQRHHAAHRAAAAGAARPWVEDGVEEAEAHGVAMAAFTRAHLPANHGAITACLTDLRALTEDGQDRSLGVATAAIAVALHALDTGDLRWLAHAEPLTDCIWATDLQARAAVALGLARHALTGAPSVESLSQRAFERADATVKDLRAFAAGTDPTPDIVLARRARAGEDVSAEVARRLSEWDGRGNRAVERLIRACALCLSDEQLEALLEEVPDPLRTEACVRGAYHGFDGDTRRGAWLARGYPGGDRYGVYTADLLHLLPASLLTESEAFFAARNSTPALAALVVHAVEARRLGDASRIIALMDQPPVSDAPWVPFHRRSDRPAPSPEALAVFEAEGLTAAIAACASAYHLFRLAVRVQADPIALATIVHAASASVWQAQHHQGSVGRIHLLADDLDAAFACLARLIEGPVEDQKAGELLDAIVARLPDRVTASHWNQLLDAVAAVHPQFTAPVLPSLFSIVLARCADPATFLSEATGVLDWRFRHAGDRTGAHLGLAMGWLQLDRVEDALHSLNTALELAQEDAWYFEGLALIEGLLALGAAVPDELMRQGLQTGFTLLGEAESGHFHQVCAAELAVRAGWTAGHLEPMRVAFEEGMLPPAVVRDLRRSVWADIADAYEPLDALKISWPAASVPSEIAKAAVRALAHALQQAQHPDAAAVAALVG